MTGVSDDRFSSTCKLMPYDISVSKVTLDIICETAFGYKADSLHNPHNELAEAYELLLSLQSGMPTSTEVSLFCRLIHPPGANLAKLITLISIPGAPQFFGSDWAYHHRSWLERVPFICKCILIPLPFDSNSYC